ncbi:MAG: hydrogenase maturation protease [Anaerolineae bacterium]|jgi:hydrogenase maturation protease|nr:hydrogenase maturation protease [Anaerolineae bacterium]MBT7070609.1 hydrogenase maturation protease [Anaerolineae bacterium]MBT7324802.1 hydrogenase maturation protease [Anaerolineae bacterium]
MTKTLIIGLGNPILGDDGVGWAVADEIKPHTEIEIEKLSLGGLSLMERISGYRRIILIDAIQSGSKPLGSVSVFPLKDLPNPFSGHSASAHDTSLLTALDTGRRLGVPLPNNDEIIIVAIESENIYNFSEELSPPIAEAVPIAAEEVLKFI